MTHAIPTGVPQTLLIPLFARATAKTWVKQARLEDMQAAELLSKLKEQGAIPDSDRFLSSIESDRLILQACVLRAEAVDQIVREGQAEARRSRTSLVVISLGAGLCTRPRRLQSSETRWVELDLPEVIALRNQIDPLEQSEPILRLSGSLFDLHHKTSWLIQSRIQENERLLILSEGVLLYFPKDQVLSFFSDLASALQSHGPQIQEATLAFDTLHPIPMKASRWSASSIRHSGARLQWGVSQPAEFSKIDPSLTPAGVVDLSGRTPGILGFGQRLLKAFTGQSFYQIQKLAWQRLPSL